MADGKELQAARGVTEFCIERGQKLFADWPVKTLFAYVFWHLVEGTCFTCRARGRITAVMFAWRMPERELRERFLQGKGLFEWRIRNQNSANVIFVAEVLADGHRAHGRLNKRQVHHLMTQAMKRWPDWRGAKIFTCRRGGGELHEIKRASIERLLQRCPDTGAVERGAASVERVGKSREQLSQGPAAVV